MAGNPPERPSKKPGPKVFACANCGASVPLRAIGLTVTVACPTCGALIDATNESYRILRKIEKKTPIKPLIPLGTRGKLEGITWEVIGFMQRSDAMNRYPWQEYLLFNPYYGFRWLTEADGHWNFVRMTKSKPYYIGPNTAVFEVEPFRLFHRGRAKVRYVLGEFYWRVKVGEIVEVEDFISPPRILSAEKSPQEITWSVGKYIAPEVVKGAFKIERAMPLQKGVAPNQVAPLKEVRPKIIRAAWIFVAIASLIQLSSCVLSPNHLVFQGTYPFSVQQSKTPEVTPPFELGGRSTNVAIHLEAPVQNSWLAVEGELVNDRTGEIRPFASSVEFYEGRDSDGYWREGSRSDTTILSGVPKGTYHLNFEVTGTPPQGEVPYNIQVRRGVPRWPNFFLALFLLGLYPFWVWWKDRQFEVARWSNSDYSPYESEDDDD